MADAWAGRLCCADTWSRPPHADSLQTLPPTLQDWPALAEFLTLSHPDTPVSADDVQATETGRLDSETLIRQVWTDTDGHWLALGDLQTPRSDAREGWLELRLRTRSDRTELAPNVLGWLLAQAATQQARTLLSRVQDDWWEHAFLEAQGFREHDRMWMSTLERGFTHARTGNHAINRPMLRMNERLGFVRDGAASLVLRHDLEAPV